MNKDDAAELVHYLVDMVEKGFTVLTWNGLGFDFDILAEESAMWESCRQLARGHVDMMFHAFCQLGYPIALDSAAAGMRLAGKQETVAAYMAPQLRADGKTDDVLSYVAQDVRATFALALTCEKQRVLKWVSRSGSVRDLALKSGWLSVDQAMSLPEPDTSWMDNRIPRSRFISWLTQRPTA